MNSPEDLQNPNHDELRAIEGRDFYKAIRKAENGEDITDPERKAMVRNLDLDNEIAGQVSHLQGLWEEYDLTGDDTIVNGSIHEAEVALGQMLEDRHKPRGEDPDA